MLHKLFDSNNSVLWLVFSGLIVIMGLAAAFFVPIFVMLFRTTPITEVGYNPSETMIWYSYGLFAMLAFALYLIYKLRGTGRRLVGAMVGVALSVLCGYFAINSYTYVDENYLEFGKGYAVYQYDWSEVTEFYYDRDDKNTWFEIVTNDGKRYEIVFGGLLGADVQNYIRRTLEGNGIKMIDIS